MQVTWIVNKFVQKPRFWSDSEWIKFNDAEKFWIWYKDIWMKIGQGNSEVDTLLFFTQGQFLTLMGMWLVVMSQYQLPFWTVFLPLAYFVVNKYFMWRIGEWKDKKDLIALESEISNKRCTAFRELRKKAMNAPYRRKK